MRPEVKKLLYDVARACDRLSDFTRGKTFSDYDEDALLRSGVERQFEIIGEALNQALKIDADLSSLISDTRRIIAFRNLLIHGYAGVDNRVVWDIVQNNLPKLKEEVALIMGSGDLHDK